MTHMEYSVIKTKSCCNSINNSITELQNIVAYINSYLNKYEIEQETNHLNSDNNYVVSNNVMYLHTFKDKLRADIAQLIKQLNRIDELNPENTIVNHDNMK